MANIYDMSDVWADGATTFTAIKMDVTNTASSASSLLMDLQVGGTSFFSASKSGDIVARRAFAFAAPQSIFSADAFGFGNSKGSGLYGLYSSGQLGTRIGIKFFLGEKNNALEVGATVGIGWSATPGSGYTAGTKSGDLYLERDAANTLAQRNGTNAQTFNLYNTYTDGSNYERGFMRWNSNVLEIGVGYLGTGSNKNIRILGPRGGVQSLLMDSGGGTSLGALSGDPITFSHSADGNTLQLFDDEVRTYRVFKHHTGFTISALPASPAVGMIARVTDGDAGLSNGSTVVNSGAGATPYLVYYTGTNWVVTGTDTASVKSDTTQAGAGAAATSNIVTISQAAYDALTPDADTIYFITG